MAFSDEQSDTGSVDWQLFGRGRHGLGRFEFPERASGERDAVRVMDEPIEDRVAKRGVPDELVPVVDRYLAGDQGGAPAAAIFDDFEEIAALTIAEGGKAPIVQDQ